MISCGLIRGEKYGEHSRYLDLVLSSGHLLQKGTLNKMKEPIPLPVPS